jgi:hypothetical protein
MRFNSLVINLILFGTRYKFYRFNGFNRRMSIKKACWYVGL